MTEAEFTRGNRLEGIFVPHARRRRDKIFDFSKRPFARFVHYTSAEGALKIITQKKLWLRNAACMADYQEVQHGFTVLLRFFGNKEKAKSFKDAVNSVAEGVADEALNLFDHWWKLGTFRFKTFILSTSEHDSEEDLHGRLSMWRAFGGNTARVGIVFNVPVRSAGAEAMRLIFSPVAYFKTNEETYLVAEAIQNINANREFLKSLDRKELVGWVFLMLLLGVTCLKHEGFREEREWRVVHCPQLYASPLITASTEIVGGVPQLIYSLPLNKLIDPILEDLDFARLFERLIIGPSQYPMAMFDAYVEALSKAGVTDAEKKIFVSNIPIRT